MPMNGVQFQLGLSMREFLSLYGTEELCEVALSASTLARSSSAITSPQQLVGFYPQCQRKLFDVVEADVPGTSLGVGHEGPMKSCFQGQRLL